ncbi:MAG: cellulase family glycosylhydrolase [Abitibacteriaceae bacterium]|nr:cellulase family glycosylhydrolase [Abditibacteriaceae bacterium]
MTPIKKMLVCALLLLLSIAKSHAANKIPWLHTDGTHIVDGQGQQVMLRGVNLGGWLVEEMWMMPFETKPPPGSKLDEIKDHVSLWGDVAKRFGPAEMTRIRAAQRDAWVNAGDFARIHAAGLDCVRLPFTYDLLEEPDGFSWLDKALNWARENNIYVVLDMHGAPGRQSPSDHTGQAGVDQLFKDPKWVQQTTSLWTKIAHRYRNRPEVAGYDLLNEPTGAPDNSTLYLVQDRLYRAIRAVDKRHMIIIEEGYKGLDSFPRPAFADWQNVVLSWHHYNFNAKSATEQAAGLVHVASEATKFQKNRPTPVFIGETQLEPYGTPQALGEGLQALQEGGHSWTTWTYKTAMRGGGGGLWGWYHPAHPLQPLDVFHDSEAELLRKIEQLRSANLEENKAMTAMFQASVQWRPLPPLHEIVPTAQAAPVSWHYTVDKPADDWFKTGFNDTGWKEGAAGFGNDWTFVGYVRTPWQTKDIWLRREFVLPDANLSHLKLLICHDDDAEVYLNGVLAAKLPGYTHTYDEEPISAAALATLKPGRNVMAGHGYQEKAGQYLDAGIVGLPG